MRLTGLFSWYLFAIVTGGSVGTERNISPVLQHSDIDLWLFHLITSNNLGVDLLNPGFPLLSVAFKFLSDRKLLYRAGKICLSYITCWFYFGLIK